MSSKDDKTEEATSHKQQEVRKEGNVPKSRDFSSALLTLAGISILRYLGPWMAWYVKLFFEKMLGEAVGTLDVPKDKELFALALQWIMWLALLTLPFLIILAILAYLINLYQVGFLFTTKPLQLKLNKINPISGIKRLFNVSNIVMLLMNMGKLAIILSVAWYTVIGEVQNVLGMVEMEVAGMFIYSTDKVLALGQKLSIILAVLGYIDFWYQKRKHAKNIRMSKQEIKEEFKTMEGDPMIKNKRRQKQMELAQQRMMQEVPQAEVVVRNPTHFAVALSFKPDMPAPMVVAKGKDKIAEQIIAVATQNRVPLVENPPLARELYKKVEIGDAIPPEFFEVVAQLIASVMTEEKRLAYAKAQAKLHGGKAA